MKNAEKNVGNSKAGAPGSDGGQSPPYIPACTAFDFDADRDIDLADFAEMQRSFTVH
jgi:hypothetical protein